jgi:hypothetical protein
MLNPPIRGNDMERNRSRFNNLHMLAAILLALGIAGNGAAGPVSVSEGMGLQFAQFDMLFPNASAQPNSGYGLAAVNFGQLTASTGISTGFLNIRTDAGWVVQNIVVDSASGLQGLGAMFNLGVSAGTPVSSVTARAEFSDTAVTGFDRTPDTSFTKVDHFTYNAQGRGLPFLVPPLPPVTPVIPWVNGGLTKTLWGGDRPSVEQDVNQCGPAAVANSLQWLENTNPKFNLPHNHVPGINGNPANSLVGQIDVAMNRAPHQTVTDQNFMNGKIRYIAENVTGTSVEIKHWGGTFVPGDVSVVTAKGPKTSHDQTNSGKTLIQWIISEIADGENVELALGNLGGAGGHWVDIIGAGTTLGVDWIAWTHDANQGNNADGTTAVNGGVNWFDGGYQFSPVVNGRPMLFLSGMQMDFAVSESVSEPGIVSLFGIALAMFGLARVRRALSINGAIH